MRYPYWNKEKNPSNINAYIGHNEHLLSELNKMTKNDYAIINDIPYAFNDSLLDIDAYDHYIKYIFLNKLRADGKLLNDTNTNTFINTQWNLAANIAPPKTAAYFCGNYVWLGLEQGFDTSKKRLEQYKKTWPNSPYIRELTDAISQKEKLQKGKPEIDFEIHPLYGDSTKLSSLKGKVVFITFLNDDNDDEMLKEQVPFANELEKYFKDKNVVFLYIYNGVNKFALQEAIDDYDIKGMFMFNSTIRENDIPYDYETVISPMYYLIDKNGNFAIDRTPPPSNDIELKSLIESLLSK